MKNVNKQKKLAKAAAVALSILVMGQCLSACSHKSGTEESENRTEGSSLTASDAGQVAGVSLDGVTGESLGSTAGPEIRKLTNHMSEAERASVQAGPLQLLDKPWEKDVASGDFAEGVYVELWTREDFLQELEEHPESASDMTPEELEQYKANCTPSILGYTVDGRNYGCMIVPGCVDRYGFYYLYEDGVLLPNEIKDMEELKKILPDLMKEYQKSEYMHTYISDAFDPDQMTKDVIRVFEAVENDQYQKLPLRTTSKCFEKNMEKKAGMDYSWELDEDAVAAIREQVTEYHLHDDQLDRDFVVHVAVPKGYEAAAKKTVGDAAMADISDGATAGESALPALVLTDAVWRFNDIAKLLSEMEAGRAKPQILISIGQDYSISNSDNTERAAVFCEGKDKFLDFITDDLMPYLGEIYAIDYDDSTLFGHSLGGVFAHYALFRSDCYENQPFGNYIVGSPAFWSPYSREMSDYKEQAQDYGYFERNQDMKKHVFITAGSDEDEDYQEYFQGGDSTTESIAHLAERINAHCDPKAPMAEAKLYKSHHYQYIPEMLVEWVQDAK